MLAVLAIAVSMTICSTAAADMLEMLDGTVITGRFMGGTQNTIRFQVDNKLQTYPKDDVLAITFIEQEPKTKAAKKAAPAPTPAAAPQPVAAAPAPQYSPTVTVPAGTRVLVRTNENLDSKRHGSGHMFTASLAADLMAGSQVVARRGSTVHGRLARAKKAGRLAGQAELKIVLTDIMINGRPYPVQTSSVKAKGEKTGRKTVRNVGVGAGIGALARGSKGAKRGAAVGLGASVLTKGSQVRIPAGTLLEFRLASQFVYTP